MELNYKIQSTITVDFSDFDEFIEEYYGHPYESAVILESRNDTTHKMGNLKIDSENPDVEHEDITKFKNGENVWIHPSDFLEDLVNKKVIPEGIYLIEVSW